MKNIGYLLCLSISACFASGVFKIIIVRALHLKIPYDTSANSSVTPSKSHASKLLLTFVCLALHTRHSLGSGLGSPQVDIHSFLLLVLFCACSFLLLLLFRCCFASARPLQKQCRYGQRRTKRNEALPMQDVCVDILSQRRAYHCTPFGGDEIAQIS